MYESLCPAERISMHHSLASLRQGFVGKTKNKKDIKNLNKKGFIKKNYIQIHIYQEGGDERKKGKKRKKVAK